MRCWPARGAGLLHAGRLNVHPAHAQVGVPELELEVSTGTLGGLVTTVEGLVRAVETALQNTQVLLC